MSSLPLLLELSDFDQTSSLSGREREALMSLGWLLRRRRGHDAALLEWDTIRRLLAPLDAATLALRNDHNPSRQPRSSKDAVATILLRCLEENSTYWNWSEEDWIRLICTHWRIFRTPWSAHVEISVRRDVVACGYLLCGFNAFHRLGKT